jgi:thiamine biosynthesis lipoprotein
MSENPPAAKSLRFASEAMHTDFTLFIDPADTDPEEAAEAARAAFAHLENLEQLLSRFVHSSDVNKVNALAPGETYLLNAESLECLSIAATVAATTERAFDPSAGALIDFWKNRGAHFTADGATDDDPEWNAAWEEHRRGEFALDPDSRLIQCVTTGSKLDLGGIGKGYALDEMARILENDWGIRRALLSAGGSTVLALDAPTGKPGWKIGFGGETQLPYLILERHALSTSGTENQPTHLVDPRTGRLVTKTDLIRAAAPSAALADALSTAFFIMPRAEAETYCSANPQHTALYPEKDEHGIPVHFDIPHATAPLLWEPR